MEFVIRKRMRRWNLLAAMAIASIAA